MCSGMFQVKSQLRDHGSKLRDLAKITGICLENFQQVILRIINDFVRLEVFHGVL